MSNTDALLKIKSRVWKKDNVELIDYLNDDTFKNLFVVNSSGVLRKNPDKKVSFHEGDNLPKTAIDLVRIQRSNNTGRYSINCGTWPKNLDELVDQQGIFMVYRGLTLKDLNRAKSYRYYKLSQGDIIKLGRIYLKVLEIKVKKDNNNDKKSNKQINRNTMLHSSNSSSLIINQQQIIKGIYSPKWNTKKHSQFLFNINNSLITARNNKNLNNNDSIDLFTKRMIMPLLPRINSSNDLFVLKKISKLKKTKSSQELDNIILKKSNPSKKKNKPSCRICYGEESDEENPLICPCICKGSMKYIHYKCLKNWLNAKIEEELSEDSNENNPDCISYNRKDIACELCKEKFPDYIIHNNIYYNILFYKPKFEEFIILESMKSSIVKNKFYHVLSLDNKEYISIGRATESDLSLAELSVSRNHCLIHKEKGKVFLEDNTSKFGTLVLIQNKNMIVNDFMTLKIQVNKTFLKFKLNIPFSFSWSCCGRSDTVERLDYQAQNKKGFDVMSSFTIKEISNNLISEENIEEEEKNKIIKDERNKINNEEENKESKGNNSVNKDNNNTNNNNENKEEKLLELIDKKSENINNNVNKNINNDIQEKDKESLIDKSSMDEKDKQNEINNISNNFINNNKDEFKEENNDNYNEKEDKSVIIQNILHNKNKDENIINRNEIHSMVGNLITNHFKRISIKKGKNDTIELPKLEQINLENIKDNIPITLLSDKRYQNKFNKIKIDIEKNEYNLKDKTQTYLNQTDSFSNNKIINKKMSFLPIEKFEHSENINNDNINNK